MALIFLTGSISASGQTETDSLDAAWKNTNLQDTLRYDARKQWIWQTYLFNQPDTALHLGKQLLEFADDHSITRIYDGLNLCGIACYVMGDYDRSLEYFQQAYDSSKALKDKVGMSVSLSSMGNVVSEMGELEKAIGMYEKAYEIDKSLGKKSGMAASLNNIAIVRYQQGDTRQAIEMYMEALRIREEMKDEKGIASVWHNIGTVYMEDENAVEALKCFEKSIIIAEKLNNLFYVASTLINMGNSERILKNFDKAESYYLRSLTIAQESGDNNGIATAYNFLGEVKMNINDYDAAEAYFLKSLEINLITNNLEGLVGVRTGLCDVYRQKGELENAISQGKMAFKMAAAEGLPAFERDAAKGLYLSYREAGLYDLALEYREIYITSRDSLMNEKNTGAIMRSRFQYEFEKKEALLLAEQESRRLLDENKIKQKNNERNAFLGGSLLMLSLAIIGYGGFRRKTKDNLVISAQKEAVFLKNAKIMESIGYARKLQEAVLPPSKVVKTFFDHSFLIYMPKDIVSGDFYWMDARDGVSYFAVGDCTGHGVPGAMLSVLGLNGLNRCVHGLNLERPDEILEHLTQMVVASFERSGDTVRDGMDIALCAFRHGGNELLYCGANSPLWIARNKEIAVYKPNRRPIGFHENAEPFSVQKIEILPGDILYLTTDGFADQMGGPSGKKLKSKNLRSRLEQLSNLPLEEQSNFLIKDFEEHKGSEEQTDDVCLMAVKLL